MSSHWVNASSYWVNTSGRAAAAAAAAPRVPHGRHLRVMNAPSSACRVAVLLRVEESTLIVAHKS